MKTDSVVIDAATPIYGKAHEFKRDIIHGDIDTLVDQVRFWVR